MSDPAAMVERGRDALCGIGDLLISVGQSNLHLVDPDNLFALIDLVREQLDEANSAIRECQKSK